MNTEALCHQGLEYHRRGSLAEAERTYRCVLALEPDSFPANYLLSVIEVADGRTQEALGHIETALKTNPTSLEALSVYGVALQAANRFGEALSVYDKAVMLQPDNPFMQFNRGALLQSLHKQLDALRCYERAIMLKPDYVDALYNQALALFDLGRLEEALASYDAVLTASPHHLMALNNRGNALRDLGRFSEALRSYETALSLKPHHLEAQYNRGIVLWELGRAQDALECYEQVLARQPNHAEALYNRGVALLGLQRLDLALEAYDAMLALEPNSAKGWNNRGVVLSRLQQNHQALASFERSLAIAPRDAEVLNNRGITLRELRLFTDALASFDQALALDPDRAEIHGNRGATLHGLRRHAEAVASYDRALTLEPEFCEALYNRSLLLSSEFQQYQRAADDLENLLRINPDYPYARGELQHVRMHAALWDGYESAKAQIDAGVKKGLRVIQPFAYQAISDVPADLQACSRIYCEHWYPETRHPRKHVGGRHQKIRLGYLSGEFREQATAHLTVGLFEHHDRQEFEIVALDSGWNDNSAMRRRLEQGFDRFVDISQLSDDAAVQRIAKEEIDILVNLNGYFGQQRMGVFARRAAPVQVNYLGFPGTVGAAYMDYILADRNVIPQYEQTYYSEKVAYLPDTYQPNDSRRQIAPDVARRADHGIPQNAFVFCNFNQSYKLTPCTFSSWMNILRRVDGSVLWLLRSNDLAPDNLRREAETRGISAERLIFADHIALDRHLARLAHADLFLDSLPYNAHTTASDALWAGVPLVTCRGNSFAGRVAASLLEALALPELITNNVTDFESLAVALAQDLPRLGALREKIAQNRTTTPLFDTDRFRRHIEQAFKTMWDIYRHGGQPQSFTVS